ncbi:MAG: hypothetical protein AB1486_14365 [Planctomycetota bacterium]
MSDYDSLSLGLRLRAAEWLQLTANIPYSFIDGKEVIWDQTAPGVDRRNEFEYSNSGLGDVTLVGWFNVLYPFTAEDLTGAVDLSVPEQKPEEELTIEGTGDPLVYLGIGVKVPTGSYDEKDAAKLKFDRSKSLTGETSESDGVLPARFQLGTGTTDGLFSLVYQQRFGRITPSLGVTYELSGGENDVGYERGDRLSWAAGVKYVLYRPGCNRQLYVSAGLSGVSVLDDDVDHSEDTTQLGPQEVGVIPDTKGTYNYYNFGGGYDITEDFTIRASIILPFDNPDTDSEYGFEQSFGLSLQYRF